MKYISVDELAYLLKEAKQKCLPQPIFFLGAGASVTGNIPLSGQLAKQILEDFPDSPIIKRLKKSEKTYFKLMACLQPSQRNELLRKIVEEAKINVTHIYLAQLLKEGYVDYVLTVNFDNLILRALSLYNLFPSTYDMAIIKDLTTTTFKEKSVIYLHGQHHGLWLLNTEEEMDRVKATVPRIFDSIKNERPWIFIGYSGLDPIFQHIKGLGRFDNGLYWVGYKENQLEKDVQDFLLQPNTNAFYIKGYDADAFMLKLNESLGLQQPEILDKPFSSLLTMLNEINDIDDAEHFKGVRERLVMARGYVEKAIKQFEDKEKVSIDDETLRVDSLKKQIIELIISEDYDEQKIKDFKETAEVINDASLNSLLRELYYNWGTDLVNLAKIKEGAESERLYNQTINIFQKAIEIKPDDNEAFNNLGVALVNLAKIKEGTESERLYNQTINMFQKAIEIKPDDNEAFNNLGVALGDLANIKEGPEAEELYNQAIDKFKKAVEIKSDDNEAFYNWGTYLGKLAKTKEGTEAEKLFNQSFDKFKKSLEIKPDNYEIFINWGTNFSNLAKIKKGAEAERLYNHAIDKFKKAIEIKPDSHEAYNNWGSAIENLAQTKEGIEAERLYKQAIDKLKKAIDINPDSHEALYNWGTFLGNLARTKESTEAEELLNQAIDKFKKAIDINPDDHEAFNNWGADLEYIARSKLGAKSEELCNQAIDKFKRAIEIKPDDYEAFNNWGTILLGVAKTKGGTKADELLNLAIDKFKKAIEIKPDNHEAFNNWGAILLDMAKTKKGKEAEGLYDQAFDNFQKAIEYGGSYYNLSCFYALRNFKSEALELLGKALAKQDISIDSVLKDEDWKGIWEYPAFIKLKEKYQKLE